MNGSETSAGGRKLNSLRSPDTTSLPGLFTGLSERILRAVAELLSSGIAVAVVVRLWRDAPPRTQ